MPLVALLCFTCYCSNSFSMAAKLFEGLEVFFFKKKNIIILVSWQLFCYIILVLYEKLGCYSGCLWLKFELENGLS